MSLPKKILVTDQEINISELSDNQTAYLETLAEEIASVYRENGLGRQIFSLSGPPGSGKSVLATIFEHIYQDKSDFRFVNISLDAFHYTKTVLTERNLLGVKGRFDTYDTGLLLSQMAAFAQGGEVSLPYYSRQDHEPVANKILVTEKNVLLFLEGQWLLRNDPDWLKVRDLYTFNLFVSGPVESMRQNIIKRHVAGGRTMEEAKNFYTESDLKNTEEILRKNLAADKNILFYKDIL